MNASSNQRMSVQQALEHLSDQRPGNAVVISNMASARLWPRLSRHPLDFHYNPSAMGGAVPFGLGLAMARPKIHVIVLSGEGSLLMSLGCLVTVAASGVTNLSLLLLDNAMFEVTGGQATAATHAAVDYIGLARASGIGNAQKFDTIEQWRSGSEAFFSAPGPRLACLEVGATPAEVFGDSLPPIEQRLGKFRQALQDSTRRRDGASGDILQDP